MGIILWYSFARHVFTADYQESVNYRGVSLGLCISGKQDECRNVSYLQNEFNRCQIIGNSLISGLYSDQYAMWLCICFSKILCHSRSQMACKRQPKWITQYFFVTLVSNPTQKLSKLQFVDILCKAVHKALHLKNSGSKSCVGRSVRIENGNRLFIFTFVILSQYIST